MVKGFDAERDEESSAGCDTDFRPEQQSRHQTKDMERSSKKTNAIHRMRSTHSP